MKIVHSGTDWSPSHKRPYLCSFYPKTAICRGREINSIFSFILGLPNEVYVLWQQYPWIFGEGLCKIRALVSEM